MMEIRNIIGALEELRKNTAYIPRSKTMLSALLILISLNFGSLCTLTFVLHLDL